MKPITEKEIKNQLNEIDFLIKNLEAKKAKKILVDICKSEIPRHLVVDISQFARRLNMPSIILKNLHPIIHSELPDIQPTDMEIALYSVGLYLNGAFQEAEKKLITVVNNNNNNNNCEPQIYFIMALCYMKQWKYKKAIGPLFQFQKQISKTSYEFLLSELNISACYQALGQSDLSLKHLEIVLKQNSYLNLKSSAHEIYAQILFSKNEYSKALLILETNIDKNSFFYKKWFYLIHLYLNYNHHSVQQLTDFQSEAKSAGQFEIVRDIDFHIFLKKKDYDSLQLLKKTSHFSSFQYRINQVLPKSISKKMFLMLKTNPINSVNQNQNNSDWVINYHSGNITFKNTEMLCLKGLVKKIFLLLLSESYSSFQIGEIFSHLYPNEYFNYHSSPKRVLQIVFRLQEKLNSMPEKIITLELKKHKIKLVFNENIFINYQHPKQKNNFTLNL